VFGVVLDKNMIGVGKSCRLRGGESRETNQREKWIGEKERNKGLSLELYTKKGRNSRSVEVKQKKLA